MPRALDAPFARRVQQRRQPARRPVDRARLGGDLALPVVDRRARVDVGAGAIELAAPSPAGSAPTAHISAVWPRHCSTALTLAPLLEQQPRRVDLAGARHDHQRRLAVGVRRLDVGAGLEQRARAAPRWPTTRRLGHRRRAVVVLRVDLGAGANQPLHQIEVVVVRPPSAAPSCRRASGALTSTRCSISASAAARSPDLTASTSGGGREPASRANQQSLHGAGDCQRNLRRLPRDS